MTGAAPSRTVRVLALSTGQGLAALVALLAAVVLARVLSVPDYATYRQTFLAYQFAAPVLTLGLPMVLYYFLPGEANGALEIPLIGVVTGALAGVILVDMRTAVVQGDYEGALRLFRLAAAKSACILLPALCFFFVFAEDIITLLFSRKYAGSVLPFRIYLLLLPVRVAFYGPALMALGWTTLVLVRSILDLGIDALLSVLLVKYMGPIGAAVATVAMLYLWCVPFNLACIAKGYRAQFLQSLPWRRMAGVLRTALVAAAGSATVPAFGSIPPMVRVLLGFLLFAALYVGVGYVLPTEVRVVANDVLGRLRVRGAPAGAFDGERPENST